MNVVPLGEEISDEEKQTMLQHLNQIFYISNYSNMETIRSGDILLFEEFPAGNIFWKLLDGAVKFFTGSKFSHSAIALRDPTWLDPNLKGLFVWESTGLTGLPDVVDNRPKFGVQIQKFDEYTTKYHGTCNVFVRRANKEWTNDVLLKTIYNDTHDTPYDCWPMDWIEAGLKVGPKKTTTRFWCSAFVCYVLNRLDLVPQSLDWSMQTPQDLATMKLPYGEVEFCI